jgi:acetoin utilization protein AcuB
MIAKNLIAYDIPALHLEQTGRDAFHLLSDYHVKHLPVVDGKQLIGLLSEEDIFNHKLYDPIHTYELTHLRRFAVLESEHVFEVVRIMGENRLTVIPVIDETGAYLGLISQNDLLRYFADTAGFTEHGAILVLEMHHRDYALGTIAQILENEGLKILNSFVTSAAAEPEMVELTLKLNRHELGAAISTLERHNYTVKETYGEIDRLDAMQERYQSLMNYLNV